MLLTVTRLATLEDTSHELPRCEEIRNARRDCEDAVLYDRVCGRTDEGLLRG